MQSTVVSAGLSGTLMRRLRRWCNMTLWRRLPGRRNNNRAGRRGNNNRAGRRGNNNRSRSNYNRAGRRGNNNRRWCDNRRRRRLGYSQNLANQTDYFSSKMHTFVMMFVMPIMVRRSGKDRSGNQNGQ